MHHAIVPPTPKNNKNLKMKNQEAYLFTAPR